MKVAMTRQHYLDQGSRDGQIDAYTLATVLPDGSAEVSGISGSNNLYANLNHIFGVAHA